MSPEPPDSAPRRPAEETDGVPEMLAKALNFAWNDICADREAIPPEFHIINGNRRTEVTARFESDSLFTRYIVDAVRAHLATPPAPAPSGCARCGAPVEPPHIWCVACRPFDPQVPAPDDAVAADSVGMAVMREHITKHSHAIDHMGYGFDTRTKQTVAYAIALLASLDASRAEVDKAKKQARYIADGLSNLAGQSHGMMKSALHTYMATAIKIERGEP